MRSAYISYILALLLFGSNGIIASYIELSSMEIVLYRTFIGSLLLAVLFLMKRNRFTFYRNKKHFGFLVLSGMAMGASWMFLYEAYQQIGVSIASLLYYCGPVIVMALAPVVFKEKLTSRKLIGFAAVLIGIVLVNGSLASDGSNLFGIICGILSAVMYSFMVIFNKKASGISGLENSLLQLAISCMTVAVVMFCRGGFAVQIPRGSWNDSL